MTLDVPYSQKAFVDAVLKLSADPDLLLKMQEREKEIAAEYGVKSISDKWLELFKEI